MNQRIMVNLVYINQHHIQHRYVLFFQTKKLFFSHYFISPFQQYSPAKTSAYKPTTTSTIIDNEKIKAIIAALSSPSSSSAPIYQMPAYYMEPKTVYKNIPYKASASNPVPILNIDAEQIQQLYGQHSLYQQAKSINQ